MKALTLEKLDAIGPFAWPGGYTNVFVVDGSDVCFECARKAVENGEDVAYGGYVSGAEQNDPCDDCGQTLDTAKDAREKGPGYDPYDSLSLGGEGAHLGY
jgi:hypothetical protein